VNFSKIFIERPVATISLTLALIIFGWFAYRSLPVSELPNVDFATITVTANLPGADPSTMASAVATPLEKQFSTIAGIDSMNSSSSLGQTTITLQFNLSRSIDAAAQDVQNAISQAQRSLPSEMTTPPYLRKVNPASTPIFFITLTGNNVPLTKLDEIAQTQIAQRLSMIDGVAQVTVFGSQQYAVRIHFNPQALSARGMDINDAISAVQTLNTHQPTGVLQATDHYYQLQTDGQLMNAAAYNQAIIAYKNGMPVRVQDVGTAVDSVANDKQATWVNQQRGIVLAVQKQPAANTIAVIDAIKAQLPELTHDLPADAALKTFYDRSIFINSALNEVKIALVLAIIFVALVILFFLGNVPATIITILALPVSLLGTFGVMYLCDYSVDNLSLMAMVLAVGFVVDDAIVVIENIVRHMEKGVAPLQSAILGSREIGFTVISMTLSLAAVFIPILFMGGIIGRLFNEFAVVVGVAILLSGVVSLTLTPMLCGRLLKSAHGKASLFPRFERFFNATRSLYAESLRWTLLHRPWVLGGMIATLIIAIFLFMVVGKGFIPSEDTGLVTGNTQVPIGVTFPDFLARQQAAAQVISQDPNVAAMLSNVGQGAGGTSTSNKGRFQILLKDRSERDLSADQVIQELRRKIQQIPGVEVFLSNPPAIQTGGAVTNSAYQYVLQSTDWNELQTAIPTMLQNMRSIPGIQDVNSDLEMTNPQISIHIQRAKAASLGVTPQQIETTLYNAFGETQISTIYTDTDEYDVIADVDPKFQTDVNALNAIYLHSSNGNLVPLNAVTKINYTAGPVSINHYGQLPAVILSFNLAPGISLSSVSSEIDGIAKQNLPSSVNGSFIGSAQTFQQSMHTLPLLLLVTILVIYLVLAILYEHFGHPITILTALPFAGVGALLMLIIFHKELDIFSFVGIIMLVGLVKKNGIMMVDFALEAKRKENLSSMEAIIQASTIRFRPIMMTTLSAILAALPMAIGFGAGGETRQAMGIAVVGGLIFSQFLTLYATPAFYLYMEEWSGKLKRSS